MVDTAVKEQEEYENNSIN